MSRKLRNFLDLEDNPNLKSSSPGNFTVGTPSNFEILLGSHPSFGQFGCEWDKEGRNLSWQGGIFFRYLLPLYSCLEFGEL
ncbi:hypothetical protein COLO4_06971 [Corchorus olitorius]|uniref:Uncharacterized protein n=1 Tax=Corchorus olitorius TaxID=93759 RepID=A0A1R3KLC2_9ROSI|nr:hypothetical protein COLO4_06971 [Corchorus olitorius]